MRDLILPCSEFYGIAGLTTGPVIGSFSGHSAAWTLATCAAPACMVAASTW
jgi:hypothetical protein